MLIQNDHTGALSTVQNQRVLAIDAYNQSVSNKAKTLNSINSDSDHIPCVMAIENHPADSRVKLSKDRE